MRSATLSDFLPDFGPRPLRPDIAVSQPGPRAPASEEVDTAALIELAVARAETELELRLVAAHHERLEAERADHASEVERIMATVGADAGAVIATRMDEMEARVTGLVGDVVARVLGGLLSDTLQTRSLEALARTISEAVGDSDALRIAVRGPLSLFETLKSALGARAARVDFSEANGFDLTVSIGDTVIETRMAEWSSALSEVMA